MVHENLCAGQTFPGGKHSFPLNKTYKPANPKVLGTGSHLFCKWILNGESESEPLPLSAHVPSHRKPGPFPDR